MPKPQAGGRGSRVAIFVRLMMKPKKRVAIGVRTSWPRRYRFGSCSIALTSWELGAAFLSLSPIGGHTPVDFGLRDTHQPFHKLIKRLACGFDDRLPSLLFVRTAHIYRQYGTADVEARTDSKLSATKKSNSRSGRRARIIRNVKETTTRRAAQTSRLSKHEGQRINRISEGEIL